MSTNRKESTSTPYTIITQRYKLKSWQLSDISTYKLAIEETKDFLIPWMPWMPWAHGNNESSEMVAERLASYRREHYQRVNYRFGIYTLTTNKLIGECGLYNRVGDDAIETGYWVHKDFLRKGIASEVTQTLIQIAFLLFDKEVVEIHCNTDNEASANIPKKLGFTLTGINESKVDYQEEPVSQMTWKLTKEIFNKKHLNQIKIQAFDKDGNPIILTK